MGVEQQPQALANNYIGEITSYLPEHYSRYGIVLLKPKIVSHFDSRYCTDLYGGMPTKLKSFVDSAARMIPAGGPKWRMVSAET